MSSTNRGTARNALDQYETPWEAVEPLLPHICGKPPYPSTRVVLDPCCGTGAMVVRAAQVLGAEARGIEVDGARVGGAMRPATTIADALTVSWEASDLILTNPPYVLAMEFVLRGVREAKRGTTVAMLLRLAFLASQARHAFHAAYPADVFVLTSRPSFAASLKCGVKAQKIVGCGWAVLLDLAAPRPKVCPTCGGPITTTTGDSADYAWFVWGPGRGGRWAVLAPLNPPPEPNPTLPGVR